MPSEVQAYYDERYRVEGMEAFPPDPSRYLLWLGDLARKTATGHRALDYGCGVGYVCSVFADLGYEVLGIDISSTALEQARRREPRAMFMKASLAGSLAFDDGTFDVITCLGVLEHVREPAKLVAELRRVARPGGRATWVVPNARSPFFWFGHGTGQVEEHPRTLDGWRELLTEGGWAIEAVRRDPGPIDRPIAAWKRVAQAALNRLPLGLTYQIVIETRPR